MDKRGISLFEVLAVIIILGIITAIAVPTSVTLIKKTKKDACERSFESIITSIEEIFTIDENDSFIGSESEIDGVFIEAGGTKIGEGKFSGICPSDGEYTYKITDSKTIVISCSHEGHISDKTIKI